MFYVFAHIVVDIKQIHINCTVTAVPLHCNCSLMTVSMLLKTIYRLAYTCTSIHLVYMEWIYHLWFSVKNSL